MKILFYVACVTVEHLFEVVIEGVNGLKLLDNMIWGEADSFVQFHFPSQTSTHDNRNSSAFGNVIVLHTVIIA